jgi:hypothetical protein
MATTSESRTTSRSLPQPSDLLLVQRGSTPYRATAEEVKAFMLTSATAAAIGAIKPGTNLSVDPDGTLHAAISGALTYRGPIDPTTTEAPAGAAVGDVYLASSEQRRRQLQTLRCSCKSEAYAAIRQGQLPFSLDQIRLERPAKQAKPTAAAHGTTADWVHPELAQVLTPNPSGDSHPHPLEIDLPPWILARGVALRRWLFSHGSALRVEAPEALRQEQQGQALEMLALAQRRPGG